ncbi:hypothetical protein [Nocardia amamiensis]|uniref:hypothetical protein n=1 Tax=Nocardia amamiensis TaxID=404578 RepID=UPI0033CC3FDA
MLLYQRGYAAGTSTIYIKHLHEAEGPGHYGGVTLRVLDALTPSGHPHAGERRALAIGYPRALSASRRRARDAVGAVVLLHRSYTYGHSIGEVGCVLVVSATRWRQADIDGDRAVPHGPLLRPQKLGTGRIRHPPHPPPDEDRHRSRRSH